jgi:outer membrane protein assembly factor BamB
MKKEQLNNGIFLGLLKIYNENDESNKIFNFDEGTLKFNMSEDEFNFLKEGKSSLGKIGLYGGKYGNYYALNICNGDFYNRLKLKKQLV